MCRKWHFSSFAIFFYISIISYFHVGISLFPKDKKKKKCCSRKKYVLKSGKSDSKTTKRAVK